MVPLVLIDHRRGGDANVRREIAAAAVAVAGAKVPRVTPQIRGLLPVTGAVVGVEGVDPVGLGGDDLDVAGAEGSAESVLGDVQGLGEDIAIHRLGEDLPEVGRVDVAGGEDGLRQVRAGARVVVVLGEHVDGAGRSQA